MNTPRRSIAFIGLLLIAPAALFMDSLFLRQVQPLLRFGRIVAWFAHHFVLGLGIFLVFMPLAALIVGCTSILRAWRRDAEFRADMMRLLAGVRAQWPALTIGATTLMAAGVLFIVGLHMITE